MHEPGKTVKLRFKLRTPEDIRIMYIQGTLIDSQENSGSLVLYMNPENGNFERKVVNSSEIIPV